MEFVLQVLETVFHKTPAAAHRIMMQVHLEGHAVCGAYSYEVAETKVATVQDLAKRDVFRCRRCSRRSDSNPCSAPRSN